MILFVLFDLILIDYSASKQWRPCLHHLPMSYKKESRLIWVKVAKRGISIFLVIFVAEQAGLGLTWSEISKSDYSRSA